MVRNGFLYTFYKGNPATGSKLLWRDLFMSETENQIRFKMGRNYFSAKNRKKEKS